MVTNSRVRLTNSGRMYTLTVRDALLTDAGDVVFTIKDLTCRTMLFVQGTYSFLRYGHESLYTLNISYTVNCFKMLAFSHTEKPVHIFRDLLNVKTVPGEDAELSCEITKPEVTIRWLKNGRLIKESPKYEMSVEKHLARLVIKSTTIRDSGEYCCEAEGVASRAKLEIRGLTFHSWFYKGSNIYR